MAATNLELEMAEVVPEPEMERAAEGVAPASMYEKNKGEDTWPEVLDETPFSTRAIQYISNHTGGPHAATPPAAQTARRGSAWFGWQNA